MAENVYEGMFILDTSRYGREPEALSGRISGMIQGAGGEMLVSRLWEERRLAYPIKGHRRGTYWLTYFRLDSSRLAEIERECKLNESILRKLFLKVDPRIVDALVTHAQTAVAPAAREGQGKQDAAREGQGKQDKGAPKPEVKTKERADTTADDSKQSDLSQATDQGETQGLPAN